MSEAIYSQEQMLKIRNENYAAGVADERERILAAIAELDNHGSTHSEHCESRHYFAERLIALIKGENK